MHPKPRTHRKPTTCRKPKTRHQTAQATRISSMLFFVIVLIMVPYFQSTLGNASTVTPSPVTAHAPASVA